jgi:hypothetical protein
LDLAFAVPGLARQERNGWEDAGAVWFAMIGVRQQHRFRVRWQFELPYTFHQFDAHGVFLR